MWDFLKKNGTIAIASPASKEPSIDRFERAKKHFQELGFHLNFYGQMTESEHQFHADCDSKRADSLIEAIEGDSDVVISLRGGYGCAKVISELKKRNYTPSKEKAIVGFSDITSLLIYFNQTFGWNTVHGPCFVHLPGDSNNYAAENIDQLLALLKGNLAETIIDDLVHIAGPIADVRGEITGGNLCMLQTTIGTSYQIDCRNKILFLEDVGERGYKIDRMLHHMLDAGIFDGALAIIYGDIVGGNETGSDQNLVMYALQDFAKTLDVPFYHSKSFGHGHKNIPIIIGAIAKISGNTLSINNHF